MSESQVLEYKKSWHDEYLKWICGFANSNGGTLYVGIDDKGDYIGVEESHRLMEEIPNKIKDTLGIIANVNLQQINQVEIIGIIIEPYPYPVNYKGKYYLRSGNTNQELRGIALDKFLLQKKGKHWDGVPVPNITFGDLEKEAIDFFLKQASKCQRIDQESLSDTVSDLMDNLHLLEGNYLKRAAILLFHKNPEKYISGAFIKIGYFLSDDELKFQDEVHGNLFRQIEKAIDLLFSKYLKAKITYDGINRIENYDYPKEAVREALLNAVAHKDYSGCVPIQISVYDDRISFWNEGYLPESWTIQTLFEKHASRPFNPDVANTLFRGGYIESWGRGTIKILNTCKKAKIPAPVFSYHEGEFKLVLISDYYYEKYLNGFELKERQRDALLYFKNTGIILSAEYQQRFGISDRTARYDLEELANKGLLTRQGKNKNRKYIYASNYPDS